MALEKLDHHAVVVTAFAHFSPTKRRKMRLGCWEIQRETRNLKSFIFQVNYIESLL
jgi:hypothetical protein